MRKYIGLLIATVLIAWTQVLADIEHTVARGESIESIAEKYGITREILLEVNKDASSLFYIGQKLIIPCPNNNIDNQSKYRNLKDINNKISPVEQSLVEEAERYFKQSEWSKAVKTYGRLIKAYPKSIYYFNRGLSYFNNNKNRQAANDLEKALSMDDCTSSMRKRGAKIIAEAHKLHNEWKERQANLIGSAIVGVAAVGLSTWAAVESAKTESAHNVSNSQSNSYSSSSSSYDTSLDSNYGEASSTSSSTTSSTTKRQCVFCNGTGKKRVSISTPTFGLPETKKKCEDCGDYYYPSNGHAHVFCGNCGGTGIAK